MTVDLIIKWQGHIVGFMRNPRVDGFHTYGTWVPHESEKLSEFLSQLDEDELEVTVSAMKDTRNSSKAFTGLATIDSSGINVRMILD